MTPVSELIGMPGKDACRLLSREERKWIAVGYRADRCDYAWNSARIVRAAECDGIVRLVFCEFCTETVSLVRGGTPHRLEMC